MAKECENCAYKSNFKSPKCGTCMVSYYDGEQRGLPSNFKPNPQTNADRIRAMSDEELARFFADKIENEYILSQKRLGYSEHALTANQIEKIRHNCCCIWKKWLKQPAEGE